MATAYASVEELELRLADMELTDADRSVAQGVLEDASNLARHYGTSWPADTAPPLVKSIVLSAAMRHMRLIEGVITSRAGDETLTWTDLQEQTGTVFLDHEQKAMLAELAGKRRTGLHSAPINAWTATPREGEFDGWVPTGPTGSQPVKYFADGTV